MTVPSQPTSARIGADDSESGSELDSGVLVEMLFSADRVADFLAELTLLAVGDVDAALSCGLSVREISASRLLTAASDEFARRMDEIQYQLDDGPCLSALRDMAIVEVVDIATDQRWPEFSWRGRAEGASASLSIPLTIADRPIGALNLYARAAGAFTVEDRSRAESLAAHASGAVALAARLAEHEERTRNLHTALSSRSTIDHAIGILMGRHRITAAAAFAMLRQTSQETNIKLREIAVRLIADTTGHPPDLETGG